MRVGLATVLLLATLALTGCGVAGFGSAGPSPGLPDLTGNWQIGQPHE